MKIFSTTLLCCLLSITLFISCDNMSQNEGGGGDGPVNNIPVQTAKNWASSWKTDITSTNLTPIQGFTLPKVDLREVLDETGMDSARFYIGKKPNGQLKLMVVGVDSNGNDMLDTSLQQYVFDFSTPCPTDCGSLVD